MSEKEKVKKGALLMAMKELLNEPPLSIIAIDSQWEVAETGDADKSLYPQSRLYIRDHELAKTIVGIIAKSGLPAKYAEKGRDDEKIGVIVLPQHHAMMASADTLSDARREIYTACVLNKVQNLFGAIVHTDKRPRTDLTWETIPADQSPLKYEQTRTKGSLSHRDAFDLARNINKNLQANDDQPIAIVQGQFMVSLRNGSPNDRPSLLTNLVSFENYRDSRNKSPAATQTR